MDFVPLAAVLIPVVAIIGGISVGIAGILASARVREARIRERIAMIEKGLVPPPEVDPAGFDRAMNRYERVGGSRRGKHRSAGITLIGVGLGLVLLISFAAGEIRAGIGVGGFLVILGLACLVNGMLEPQRDLHTPGPPRPPMPPTA